MNKVFVIGLSGNSYFLKSDHLPKKGETLITTDFSEEVGGKGYNQVVTLKKLGCDAFFLSSIGSDDGGKKCVLDLKERGINFSLLEKDDKTAFAYILRDKFGENVVLEYPGASLKLKVLDVLEYKEEIEASDVLSLQFEVPFSCNLEAISIAKEKGVKIVINPAPYNSEYKSLLQFADVITPNEVEAREIFNLSDDEPLDRILDKMEEEKLKEVIVTIGKNGAIHFKDGIMTKYETIKVKAIDTTGAGDSFNAMLCYALANNYEVEDAIIYSNICASLSTLYKGAINSDISLDIIKEQLK